MLDKKNYNDDIIILRNVDEFNNIKIKNKKIIVCLNSKNLDFESLKKYFVVPFRYDKGMYISDLKLLNKTIKKALFNIQLQPILMKKL